MAEGNIVPYTNPNDILRPTETGVEATAQAALRSNRIFTELGATEEQTGRQLGQDVGRGITQATDAAIKYEDHRQISHGSAAEVGLVDQAMKQWDDTMKNADPNDPTLADRFKEKTLEPMLEDFQKGFTTERSQEWATTRADEIRKHFDVKTAVEVGDLAKTAFSVNVQKTGNGWADIASRSPGSVPWLLSTVPQHIKELADTSPNLKGEVARSAEIELTQKASEGIVLAGARKAIQDSPDPEAAAAAWTAKYPQYLKEGEAKQIASEARTEIRFRRVEANAAQAEQRRQNTEKFHSAANQFELSLTKEDPNTHALVPATPENVKDKLTALANMPDADPSRVSAIIAKVEHDGVLRDETTRANIAQTSTQTQARLFEEHADPAAIDKEYADHKGTTLTWEARTQLINNYYADKSVTGEPLANSRKSYLTANEGNIDPARIVANLKSGAGSVAINQAEQALRGAEDDYRKAGKDPQALYQYDAQGHSPADAIIQRFKVPLSALPANLQSMLGVSPPVVANAPPVPAALKGIASLGWSPSKKLWYDQTTGDAYEQDGTRHK
jgi:hypothetical protein